jgi:hypothetical protein
MKHLVALCLLLISLNTLAQTDSITRPDSISSRLQQLQQENDALRQQVAVHEKQKLFYRKNNVKINVSSLFLNNYNFYYERSLSRKISFSAGYRVMPKTILTTTTLGEKAMDLLDEDDDDNDLSKMSLSNNTITGEFRFYGGRKPGARGFYLSVYGRYSKFSIDYPYDFHSGGKNYKIPLKGNLTGFGGGLMIGAQWLIARRVVLDWYILGLQYGKMTGNVDGLTDLSAMSQADKDYLRDDIEGIISIGDKEYIKATVTDDGVRTKFDGPFAGIRAAGISLGIAF